MGEADGHPNRPAPRRDLRYRGLRAFDGNHAHVGRATSLIFLLGMIAVLFAQDTRWRDIDK